ncbi:hypothetical protein JL09_g7099, partial [Pichia kudriavzevii]
KFKTSLTGVTIRDKEFSKSAYPNLKDLAVLERASKKIGSASIFIVLESKFHLQ